MHLEKIIRTVQRAVQADNNVKERERREKRVEGRKERREIIENQT
jgi:hypothetical protein